MLGFGLVMGIIFPVFSLLVGIPREYVINELFIISCLSAGLIVGMVNNLLAKTVVGKRLRILFERMQYVNENSKRSGELDIEECKKNCMIPVDSDDIIGETSAEFNNLIQSFLESMKSEASMRTFTEIFTNELDVYKLSKNALGYLINYTNSKGGIILINNQGTIEVANSYLIKTPEKLIEMEIIKKSFKSGERTFFNFTRDIIIEAGLIDFTPKAILIEPINYKGNILGLIILASINEFTPAILNDINVYTHGLSLGMNNAVIHRKLEELTIIDPLTSAYNRRYGMEKLKEEFNAASQQNYHLGVLMLDIDHFKKVNDTYGHVGGDLVLKEYTKLISSLLRKDDTLIRFGGEEFMVIMAGIPKNRIISVAENIRTRIENAKFLFEDKVIEITTSIGGALYPEIDAVNEETLVQVADQNLYKAKNQGRNRVIV